MKTIVYVAITVVLVGWVVMQKVTAQKLKNYRLSVAEFKQAISEGKIQLIDVRTANEYKSGHIPKAINMDVLSQSNFKQQIETLDKNRPTYIYCRSGKRSLKALNQMIKNGYTHIYDLKGGYLEWNK
ncbi:rhodanese-like domain-containing protein [Wenyingzhuangia aestuarii]|uniref:rhodanese-like domain-containing protein n=1 Tax=Wenyingzhuangia aestuarii TaxID=1647582 RepID=UPI001FD77D34|nr:rhodanese-like domain-containing protein [Wenyingzhuangia aestuarii]NJB82553.1 rhodanese-related sulfurtransferase [Wenyingzhuangia aestuarii]